MKGKTVKRILAWIILAGFVLLLLNMAIFHFYWQISAAVYVVIIIFFVLTNGKMMFTDKGAEQDHAAGDNNDADALNTAGDVMDKADYEKETDEGKTK